MTLFRNKLFYISLVCSAVFAYMYYPLPVLRHLAWFILIPYLVFVHRESFGKVILTSWLCGVIYFLVGIFWLTEVTVAGYVVLSVLLALYWLVFGLLLLPRQSADLLVSDPAPETDIPVDLGVTYLRVTPMLSAYYDRHTSRHRDR